MAMEIVVVLIVVVVEVVRVKPENVLVLVDHGPSLGI